MDEINHSNPIIKIMIKADKLTEGVGIILMFIGLTLSWNSGDIISIKGGLGILIVAIGWFNYAHSDLIIKKLKHGKETPPTY